MWCHAHPRLKEYVFIGCRNGFGLPKVCILSGATESLGLKKYVFYQVLLRARAQTTCVLHWVSQSPSGSNSMYFTKCHRGLGHKNTCALCSVAEPPRPKQHRFYRLPRRPSLWVKWYPVCLVPQSSWGVYVTTSHGRLVRRLHGGLFIISIVIYRRRNGNKGKRRPNGCWHKGPK